MPASISVRPDGVGFISMDSPPVNSLGTELVTSFKQEFPKLVQDPKAPKRLRNGSETRLGFG